MEQLYASASVHAWPGKCARQGAKLA